MPNFMPSFRKILRAVFEKSHYERTDGLTDKTDSIGPSGFQLGTKKSISNHKNINVYLKGIGVTGKIVFFVMLKFSLCFLQKKGHTTFKPLWMPNFMPGFIKILRAVFEKNCSGRTDGWTNETDSIGPSGFQLGTNNMPNICQ